MNSPFLGVDFGRQRTGLAYSESGIIARPLEVLEADRPHMHKVLQSIVAKINELEVRTVVIGLPFTEDGADTSQSNYVHSLIAKLESRLRQEGSDATILTVNEFYSSEEAKEAFPDAPIDSAAAAVILQHLLDQP